MIDRRGQLFEERLRVLRSTAPTTVPHLVDGHWIEAGEAIERVDPSCGNRVVSTCGDAPDEVVDRAVNAARREATRWGQLPAAERGRILAGMLPLLTEERRADIATRIALETGKTRAESYGEVDELAVLVERYAAIGADPAAWEEPLTQVNPVATSHSVLRPYGVFGVISPFNYPMVLGAGPAIAALVAGNTVVWKPSHIGPWSAHAFAELAMEAGLPPGVLSLVQGGDAPGRRLVDTVDGVAFTGSVEAGLAIREAASGGPYPRPVIAELGGKNPVVVTDTADLEMAAGAIATAAFGMSGQRCSAASRVVVTTGAHDRLVKLLSDVTEQLVVGDPIDPSTFMGPVVDERARARFERSLDEGRRDGTLVTGSLVAESTGHFVRPAVVAGLAAGHRLTREELFLPFLTVTAVPDFAAAVAEANATPFGLTAGIYTGVREEAEQFLQRIESGCVNVNKPGGGTTGWWPGNQTFGGWKASGLSGKQAFGQWYVQQFGREQCRTIANGWE